MWNSRIKLTAELAKEIKVPKLSHLCRKMVEGLLESIFEKVIKQM